MGPASESSGGRRLAAWRIGDLDSLVALGVQDGDAQERASRRCHRLALGPRVYVRELSRPRRHRGNLCVSRRLPTQSQAFYQPTPYIPRRAKPAR